jgi:hypothetical protein
MTCVANMTDSIGSILRPLPSFMTFNQTSLSLTINTADSSKSGTYYLLLDYFLSYLITDMNSKHTKRLVSITVDDSPQLSRPWFINQTIENATSSLPSEPVKSLNESSGENQTSELNSKSYFADLILSKLQANQTETNSDSVSEVFTEIQDIPSAINLINFLPQIKPS